MDRNQRRRTERSTLRTRCGDISHQKRTPQYDLKGRTAVITGAGRFKVMARGQALDNQLRFTDVWVLRDGRWQLRDPRAAAAIRMNLGTIIDVETLTVRLRGRMGGH